LKNAYNLKDNFENKKLDDYIVKNFWNFFNEFINKKNINKFKKEVLNCKEIRNFLKKIIIDEFKEDIEEEKIEYYLNNSMSDIIWKIKHKQELV